jgi:inorganic pyrophosphatase
MHPWHDLSPGLEAPEVVQSLIEIPKGTRAKYEIDKVSGLLKLDRVLFSSMYYPTNYGFIPQTYCGDGDPLDILVLSQVNFEPRCLVDAIPIGVMRMYDKGQDDKIIAVCANDISVSHIREIEELPVSFQEEIINFFEEYKKLERKLVDVEPLQNSTVARKIILEAIAAYQTNVNQLNPSHG